MSDQASRERTMSATDVRAHWSQLLLDVFNHKARVLVQKGGIPIAAIIPIDELKRYRQIEQERAERFRVIAEGWEAFNSLDLGDVDVEVARAVAEARSDLRAEWDAAAREG
jgi:antitoxin (DNA-binding transcriptional repressor) of toxin-antitoxin stability system